LEIALKIIRKIFPYHSNKQKTEKGCLDFQIGLCPGPYAEAISRANYLKNIRNIKMILEGKKKSLVKRLEIEMRELAKKHEFEKAGEVRNKIFALNHIRDIALISKEENGLQVAGYRLQDTRIEAYDISNISGQYATGSMAVFKNNEPDKSQYRKFKIKTVQGADDVGMMREVLIRRFNNDWPSPELILLDGGKGHLNMYEGLMCELKLKIPAIAVSKGPTRKISNFQFLISNQTLMTKFSNEVKIIIEDKNLLGRIISEAHRFAITYHKKVRKREFYK
jgi:excinuclease ABC subunit C